MTNHLYKSNLIFTVFTLWYLTALPPLNAQSPGSEDSLYYSQKTYTYKVVGDCKISADVYKIHGDTIRPAILWIHGGALILGNRGMLDREQLELYLRAGYVVVSIDYRLAPETKLEAIIEDLRDAYKWVREKGPGLFKIDPNRVAVIGHSAGGYLTLMTGFCVDPPPAALVSFYGYGDIAGEWYNKPDSFYCSQPAVLKEEAYGAVGGPVISESPFDKRFRFYIYCRQYGIWPKEVCRHDPNKEPNWFIPYCPIRNVTKKYPPVILLHGDKDTDVPYEQSVLMAKELERQSIEHELITMPGYGHVFDLAGKKLKEPAIADAFNRVLEFLKKHVGQ